MMNIKDREKLLAELSTLREDIASIRETRAAHMRKLVMYGSAQDEDVQLPETTLALATSVISFLNGREHELTRIVKRLQLLVDSL